MELPPTNDPRFGFKGFNVSASDNVVPVATDWTAVANSLLVAMAVDHPVVREWKPGPKWPVWKIVAVVVPMAVILLVVIGVIVMRVGRKMKTKRLEHEFRIQARAGTPSAGSASGTIQNV